ncbi:MAG: cryptochrome/photolyase family protein, partial [Bacteroidia bacterium]|nr:cryptochrome/photolyase family protein [Bacteroidia bacterium]
MKLFLVYPHQLFAVEHLPPAKEVWVIEEPLYFADPIHAPIFHKQKLILHRASLRRYADQLREAGYVVEYWAYGELMREGAPRAAEILLRRAYSRGFREVHLFEPVDYLLERRLAWAAERCAVQLRYHDTPGFLTSRRENLSFQSQQKRYHQTSYYIWQRKRLNILLTPEGQPVGGKWTYDVENRKRLPKGHRSPPIIPAPSDPYVEEATIYSEKHFPQAWGAAGPWWLPTSHESARRWLRTFLEERLHGFGPYEDAFESEEPFLYHSILTPSLNIGLLTPAQVLQETLSYAKETEVPLSSLEGFIRQIIGWREYIRMVYDTIGTPLRKSNLWHHTQDFPEGWETATTGILPVDTTLRRLYRWGYTHHIERLMVLGSFLFLNE